MTGRELDGLLDASPVAVVIVDAAGLIRAWNPAAERLLGWPGTEVIGRAPPFEGSLMAAFDEVRASRPVHRELVVTRRDGRPLDVAISCVPQREDGGFVAVMMLREAVPSAQRYRSFFEHALDAVLLISPDGRVLDANPAAGRLFGYPGQTFTQVSIYDLFDPTEEHGALAKAHFARALSEGHAVGDVVLKKKTGDRITVDVNAVRVVDGVLEVIRDVTAQRELERHLRFFANVFETSGEAVIVTDAQNRIVLTNPAFTDVTGYVLEEVKGKDPRLLSSGRHDPDFYAQFWQALSTTGHWQGELWNRRKTGEVYPEWATINVLRDQTGAVANYVAVFSDITKLKMSEARASWLAHHDSLTGLPNRMLLRDRLGQALASARRTGKSLAVLLIDLDGFKTINDSLGHHAGDELLQETGRRLQDVVRQGDTVSRMGGDEFVVLVQELAGEADAIAVVNKVMASVSAPVQVAGREIHPTPSVGIALFPQDGTDLDTLVRNADAAMYAAKEHGRNGYQFFTSDMNTRALERLTLVHALRGALEHNELFLMYQPKFDATGIIGVEALIRWRHPELGLVPPDRFIPLAEDAGLIQPIGEWVLRTACVQARKWEARGYALPVAVNISPLQVQHDLLEAVKGALDFSGLSAPMLELELTEGAVLRDPAAAADTMKRLRATGVRLSIDDFGTGYSSLSQLKRFPIERLKIDRSFVRDVLTNADDMQIVKAIITLGHTLRLQVTAEGVETGEQLELLQSLSCDEFQGYHLARPLEVPALEALLETRLAAAITPP